MKSPYALAVSLTSLELGNPTLGETRSLIAAAPNWAAFISMVERHGIAEIVLRLAQTHCLALPDFVFAKLKGLAVRHSASARARYKVMQIICEELRAKKLDFAVLKGTALLPLIYHDEARRPMRDIDILVRREQRADVAHSMEAIGFDLPKTHPDKYSRDSHQMPNATLTVDGFIISLEIHHDAIDRDTKGHLYFDEFIELREVTWREVTFAALNHEMMLHHLCRHLASRHPGSFLKLINVIDVIRYTETVITEIDWDVIKRRYPHVLNTLRCLHVLIPLPATIVKVLGGVSREKISGAGEIAMSLRDVTVSSVPIRTKFKLMFCPSDWWLHLFYGVAPEKSLFWVKSVSHPSAIVVMIIRRAWSRLLGG
ncbi:nucleotidyltransferase family protein [Luminiphilus sp.]|nr:nucleotidyltransferase family protein [Luminiphilus sp.]